MAIRAIAQSGVVFPASNRAGVILRKLNPTSACAVRTLRVNTYLSGALQDSFAVDPAVANPAPDPEGHPKLTIGFETSAPFDAVELISNTNGCPNMAEGTQVFEFCSNS